MVIVIKNSAAPGTAAVLCDGATHELNKSSGPTQVKLAAPVDVEIKKIFRAAGVTVINRGNQQTNFSFSVAHRAVDAAAAAAWLALHIATVLREDTVEMLLPEGVKIVIPNAVLREPAGDTSLGATVAVRYDIVGGIMVVTT